MHRARAREYGLVRTCTDLYGPSFAGGFGGQAAQGYVGAVRSGNSKAQGTEVGQNIPVHCIIFLLHFLKTRLYSVPTLKHTKKEKNHGTPRIAC